MSKRFESNTVLSARTFVKLLFTAMILIVAFSTFVFSEEGNVANSNQKAVTEFIYRRLIGVAKALDEDFGGYKRFAPVKDNQEIFSSSDWNFISDKPVIVESRQHFLELLGAGKDLSGLSKGQLALLEAYDAVNSPEYKKLMDYAGKTKPFQSSDNNKVTVELADATGVAEQLNLDADLKDEFILSLSGYSNVKTKKIFIGSPEYDGYAESSVKSTLFHETQHLTQHDPGHEYGDDGKHYLDERLGDSRGSESDTAYSEGQADWRGFRSNENDRSSFLENRFKKISFEKESGEYELFNAWDKSVTADDLLHVGGVDAKVLYALEQTVGVEKLQQSFLNTNEGPGRLTRVVEDVIANNPEKTAEILGAVDQHTYQKFSPEELRALGAKGDVSQVDEYLAIRDFALSDGVSEKQAVVADADQTAIESGVEKDQSRSLMTTPDEESSSAKVAGLAPETTPTLSKTQLGIQNVKNSLKSGFSPSNLLVTAGMAVGMNLISQTINGEKPSVEKALQSVATAEFAGSVIGGTLGAAAGTFAVPFLTGIPVVGALAPVLCAVAGSTIGAASAGELKNGNFSVSNVLKRVDWTSVAGQSVGSLAGTTAAIALVAACPVLLPVALPLTVIGGMAGGVIGDYAAHLIASLFNGASQESKTFAASSDVSSTEIPDDVGEKAVPTKVKAGLEVQNKNPLSE